MLFQGLVTNKGSVVSKNAVLVSKKVHLMRFLNHLWYLAPDRTPHQPEDTITVYQKCFSKIRSGILKIAALNFYSQKPVNAQQKRLKICNTKISEFQFER